MRRRTIAALLSSMLGFGCAAPRERTPGEDTRTADEGMLACAPLMINPAASPTQNCDPLPVDSRIFGQSLLSQQQANWTDRSSTVMRIIAETHAMLGVDPSAPGDAQCPAYALEIDAGWISRTQSGSYCLTDGGSQRREYVSGPWGILPIVPDGSEIRPQADGSLLLVTPTVVVSYPDEGFENAEGGALYRRSTDRGIGLDGEPLSTVGQVSWGNDPDPAGKPWNAWDFAGYSDGAGSGVGAIGWSGTDPGQPTTVTFHEDGPTPATVTFAQLTYGTQGVVLASGLSRTTHYDGGGDDDTIFYDVLVPNVGSLGSSHCTWDSRSRSGECFGGGKLATVVMAADATFTTPAITQVEKHPVALQGTTITDDGGNVVASFVPDALGNIAAAKFSGGNGWLKTFDVDRRVRHAETLRDGATVQTVDVDYDPSRGALASVVTESFGDSVTNVATIAQGKAYPDKVEHAVNGKLVSRSAPHLAKLSSLGIPVFDSVAEQAFVDVWGGSRSMTRTLQATVSSTKLDLSDAAGGLGYAWSVDARGRSLGGSTSGPFGKSSLDLLFDPKGYLKEVDASAQASGGPVRTSRAEVTSLGAHSAGSRETLEVGGDTIASSQADVGTQIGGGVTASQVSTVLATTETEGLTCGGPFSCTGIESVTGEDLAGDDTTTCTEDPATYHTSCPHQGHVHGDAVGGDDEEDE